MTIHFEGHRYGMTVNPPLRDEATGEIIEGSEQVVDTRFANWNHEPNEYDPELEKEAINEDEDHPDYVSEEVRMADTQQDILTAEEQSFDESLAASISSVDLGTTPADITVQHLVTQYYLGNISRDEAFEVAISSGISPESLMQSYWNLKKHFE